MLKDYYVYDHTTHKYLGTIHAEIQPENTTEIPPQATLNGVNYYLDNAVFDPVTKTWSGDNASYQVQKQVALLTQMVVAQGKQINALKEQLQAK